MILPIWMLLSSVLFAVMFRDLGLMSSGVAIWCC